MCSLPAAGGMVQEEEVRGGCLWSSHVVPPVLRHGPDWAGLAFGLCFLGLQVSKKKSSAGGKTTVTEVDRHTDMMCRSGVGGPQNRLHLPSCFLFPSSLSFPTVSFSWSLRCSTGLRVQPESALNLCSETSRLGLGVSFHLSEP